MTTGKDLHDIVGEFAAQRGMRTTAELSATETIDHTDFGWRWLQTRNTLMAAIDSTTLETVGYRQVLEIVSAAVVDLKAASISAVDAERF